MFNITQIGNRVDIESEGVDFTITKHYLTGTYLPIAYIRADGYDWEITHSGTAIANVKLVQPSIMSSGWHLYNGDPRWLQYPWATHQTMGDVGITGSLTPTLIDSWTTYNTPVIESSSRYAFIWDGVTNPPTIKRINLIDNTSISWVGTDKFSNAFCAYNDNTIYVLLYNYVTEKDEIMKVVYDSLGTTETLVYSWDDDETYEGQIYGLSRNIYFGNFKNSGYNCIVLLATEINLEGSPTPPSYIGKCVSYNINTNSASSSFFELNDGSFDPDANNVYWQYASPSFHQNEIIWAWQINDMSTNKILLQPYIFDITDCSVTLLNAITYSFPLPYVDLQSSEGTINHFNGMYYFTAYIDTEYHLFGCSTITGITADLGICDRLIGHQGPNHGYAIDLPTSPPGDKNIVDIPDLNTINTVSMMSLQYYTALSMIDIDNDMIWTVLDTDILQGKALDGGTTRNITIDWSGGSLPFLYSSSRTVYLLILDGKCIITIISRRISPLAYQRDIYLVKEAS